jgi:hypothetical protein
MAVPGTASLARNQSSKPRLEPGPTSRRRLSWTGSSRPEAIFRYLSLEFTGLTHGSDRGVHIRIGGPGSPVLAHYLEAHRMVFENLMILDFERASAAAFSYSKYVVLALGTATILLTCYMFRTGSSRGHSVLTSCTRFGTLLFVLVLLFVGLSTWRQLIFAAQLCS